MKVERRSLFKMAAAGVVGLLCPKLLAGRPDPVCPAPPLRTLDVPRDFNRRADEAGKLWSEYKDRQFARLVQGTDGTVVLDGTPVQVEWTANIGPPLQGDDDGSTNSSTAERTAADPGATRDEAGDV